jgi:hypothetical protein
MSQGGCQEKISGNVSSLICYQILIVQRAMTSPEELWVLAAMVGAAFPVETVYQKATGRLIKS